MLQELDEAGNRAQVIVLDNLSTLRRGVNENDNTETQDLITWLVSLRHRGYTVIIVHHSGKSGQQRGASIIEVPMDYVIKLSAPEKNAPIFGDGARFGVTFEKVRKKMPKQNDFTALLRPEENNKLQLYYDQHDEKIDDYFFVLRVIGKEGDISQRQIAKTLSLSVGKVNGAIKRLAKDGLITNSRNCKVPTTYGRKTLHEIWPDLFTPPAQSELEADDGVPF
ncbi:AAA family ATPase [Alphaproteobacteria bacterium]|nr:AAA family ATPase [Alphaproteobacteria bacterium]